MLIGIFWFLFGLIIGSFLNVLVIRLGTGESVVSGGSRCLSCRKRLYWPELIPLISFFIFRGRCRTCGSRISRQYPAVELATGIVFLLLWIKVQPNFQFSIFNFHIITILSFLFTAAIASLLIAISVYDIRHQIIPNRLVYPFIALAFVFLVLNFAHVEFGHWDLRFGIFAARVGDAVSNVISGVGLFAFFALLWLLSRGRWMGFGDAKLALGIGLWLGWPLGAAAFFFAFAGGAVIGVFLLIFSHLRRAKAKYSLASHIPFGPFFAAGALTAFFIGARAINWYLRFFF